MIKLGIVLSSNTYIQPLLYTKIGGHFLHTSAGMTAVQFFVQSTGVMDAEHQLVN